MKFSVDVLTPSSVLAKDLPADSLMVSTVGGQIQILPNHTHIIEKLDTGSLTIYDEKNQRQFTVTSGICKLLQNKVTILSTASEEICNIDKDRAQRALKTANEKLSSGDSLSDDDLIKYRRKIDRAELRLKMALRE
jgi:F-type H+-transporting ATPase subunit epsilon